jgi:ABC-type metal ion transport system substrate-binding protein
MKTFSVILGFIFGMVFTLVLIVGIVIGSQQQTDQEPQVTEVTKVVEVVRVDETMLDRIDELTRQNENKDIEIKALKDYIEGNKDLWWKE